VAQKSLHKPFLINRIGAPARQDRIGKPTRSDAGNGAQVGQLSGDVAEMLVQHEASEAQEGITPRTARDWRAGSCKKGFNFRTKPSARRGTHRLDLNTVCPRRAGSSRDSIEHSCASFENRRGLLCEPASRCAPGPSLLLSESRRSHRIEKAPTGDGPWGTLVFPDR
jgi:hypothetical protein